MPECFAFMRVSNDMFWCSGVTGGQIRVSLVVSPFRDTSRSEVS